MTAADSTAALEAAGLTGWRSLIKPLDEAVGYVAVITSPDFHPVTRAGRLFAGRGVDEREALAGAIAKARAATQ